MCDRKIDNTKGNIMLMHQLLEPLPSLIYIEPVLMCVKIAVNYIFSCIFSQPPHFLLNDYDCLNVAAGAELLTMPCFN